MHRNTLKLFIITAALSLIVAIPTRADIKVKTRTSVGGQSYEGTTYIKKARKRAEQSFGMMRTANIEQCDLRRNIQVNEAARTYLITPFDTGAAAASTDARTTAPAARQPAAPTRQGGIINYTSKMTDTGERKQMFGLTARRVKTEMNVESSPEACTKQKMRMETDGWYVDFSADFNCPVERQVSTTPMPSSRPDCQDQVRFKTIGTAKLGYPLEYTMTMYDEAGRATSTIKTETLELSQATLDAALFDIPAGYTEVKDAAQLYAQSAAAMANMSDDNRATSGSSMSGAMGSASASSVASAAPIGAKKPGVVRVGVAMPKAQVTGDARQAAEGVRNSLVQTMAGPAIEVIPLDARLPVQVDAEAKQKECDYILYASVTQKKGGGGGGMFGRALGNIASSAAGHIPYGNTAGEAAARGAATSAIYTAASMSGSIKAKDEITLDYSLMPAGSQTPVVTNKLKAKAKQDGEDVLTPLVEQAASATLAAAVKK